MSRPRAVSFATASVYAMRGYGGGGGLDVELPRLCEVGGAQVEVLDGEQMPGRLTDRTREDRRVDHDEVPLVEEVPDRLDHLVAHPRDRDLAPAPQPEVAMFEQERGAVLFRGDGEIDAGSENHQVGGGELDAAGGARVGAHRTGDFD